MNKKNLFSIALFCIIHISYTQVGVGNINPRGLLDLNDNQNGDATAGLVIPHADDVTTLINPESGQISNTAGTIAFDSSLDCIRLIRNDGNWTGCLSSLKAFALDCSTITHNESLTENVNAGSGVTSVVSYTNGNGESYDGQSINTNGLTATLRPGNFANGLGTLTFEITGTPASSDDTQFNFTINGQSCSFTRSVEPDLFAGVHLQVDNNSGLSAGILFHSSTVRLSSYPVGVERTVIYNGSEIQLRSDRDLRQCSTCLTTVRQTVRFLNGKELSILPRVPIAPSHPTNRSRTICDDLVPDDPSDPDDFTCTDF